MDGRRGRRLLFALAGVTALWELGVACSGPFLDAYLWSAGSRWTVIGLFNLAQYLAMVAVFPAAGWLAKGFGAQTPIRVAVLAVGGVFALVLALGPQATRHVFPLGLMLGLGWGLYWLGQFVFGFELTSGKTRDRWQATMGILGTIAGLAAPLLGGFVVADYRGLTGFRRLFAASLILLTASLLCTGLLDGRRSGRRAPARTAGRDVRPWMWVILAQAALALRDGVYLFAPALLVFTLSHSPISLGAYVAATELVALAAYAATARWANPAARRPSLLAGSAASTAAGLVLAIVGGVAGVWAFGVIGAALRPLVKVPVEACTLDVIGVRPEDVGERGVDMTVSKEIVVNATRALATGALVLAISTAGPTMVRWCLVVVAASPWIAWWAFTRFPPPAL